MSSSGSTNTPPLPTNKNNTISSTADNDDTQKDNPSPPQQLTKTPTTSKRRGGLLNQVFETQPKNHQNNQSSHDPSLLVSETVIDNNSEGGIINPYSTPVEETSSTHYDETTINTRRPIRLINSKSAGNVQYFKGSSEESSPIISTANITTNQTNQSHFSMATTPAASFKKPILNVDIPHNPHHKEAAVPTSSAANFTFGGGTRSELGSIILKRNQSKPSTPIQVELDELQPYDSRISMDISTTVDGQEEGLILHDPPTLKIASAQEAISLDGVTLSTIPHYLLRPSDSMESISSLALDPTMQPEILENEQLKRMAEREFTNGGNSALGVLFSSAHNIARKIENKTGVSLKDRMPMVFSSQNLEQTPSFFKRVKKKVESALTGGPQVLLPSQRRTIRAYTMKKLKNTLKFQKKVIKAREKHLKAASGDKEEEELIDGADVSVETDSSTSEDGTAMLRLPVLSEDDPLLSKPKTRLEKIKSSFKYFFTGQSEKNQSRVLYKDLSSEDRKKVHSLLIDLAYALSVYGLSSYKVEYHLTLISTYYGIDAYYSVNTSGIWIGFGHRPKESNDNMYTYFIKLESQTVNMDKLTKLDQVASRISHGLFTIDEAQAEINRIIQEPVIYSHPMINLFFHFLTPGLFVALWKGNLAEVFTCFLIGLILGVVNFFFSRMPVFSTIIPAVASLIGGLVGVFMKWILFSKYYISVGLVALCTSYQFLPGSIITVALSEISIGNSLAGVVRLTNAFSIILKLGFGLIFTAGIVGQISFLNESEAKDIERVAIPIWLRIFIVLVLSLATMISRKVPAEPKIIVAVLGTSLAAHLTNFFLSFLQIEISTVLAAIVVGLLANIFTVFTHTPPVVVAGVAVLMLSPGSMSYRGMASFIYTNNTQAGVNFFLDVLLVGVAIFIGLTIANHVIPIRQKINM